MLCSFCGKKEADHNFACMPEPLGPSSDFGWQDCHGCNKCSDRWDVTPHDKTCPGGCVKPYCLEHNKRPPLPIEGKICWCVENENGKSNIIRRDAKEFLEKWHDSFLTDAIRSLTRPSNALCEIRMKSLEGYTWVMWME